MLLKIRKFFGGFIMIISVIFGAVSVGIGYGEPIILTLFMYLLVGVLPFILALFLVKGKQVIQLNPSGLRSFLGSKECANGWVIRRCLLDSQHLYRLRVSL